MKDVHGNAQVRKLVNGTDNANELAGLLNGFVEVVMQRDWAELSVSAV